ncbi:MAG: CotH kinase family protein [Fibrobacter sp.]|nr:CotH kinase family protein [Fibrobacter sp.]
MNIKISKLLVGWTISVFACLGGTACSDNSSSSTAPEDSGTAQIDEDGDSADIDDISDSREKDGGQSGSDVSGDDSSSEKSGDSSDGKKQKEPDKSHNGPVEGEDPNMQAVEEPLAYVGGSSVIFTEVSPENANFKDNDGNDPGWVELYNTTDAVADLNGVALSNDAHYPRRWVFGDVKISAKSYLVVFLSGKNYTDYIAPSDSVNMIGANCETEVSAASGIGGMDWGNMGDWGGMGDFGGMGGDMGGWGNMGGNMGGNIGNIGGNAGANAGGNVNSKVMFAPEDVNNNATNVANLPGQSSICFTQDGANMFGSVLKVASGASYSRIVVKSNTTNISKVDQLVIKGFVTKNHKIRLNFKEGEEMSRWSGKNLKGTGDSVSTYYVRLAENANNVNFSNISATTFASETQGSETTTIKVTSYIARKRGHEPHTTFKSESAGSLYLVDKDNGILDSVTYSAVPVGASWSRSNDGKWGFAAPSPYGNTVGEVAAVQASSGEASIPPSGFYSQPINVKFAAGTRCEVGGTEPTANSPEAQDMTISTTTVLRCVAYADGAYPSDMINRTYIFEQAPSVAALFVTTDPLSMFSADSGLYMTGDGASMMDPKKGANFWSNRELPVVVDFFEPGQSQKPAFTVKGDYKISGQYSRAKEKKSFSVTLREEYGAKRLKYNLFPDYPELKKFKAFSVRNFGNNCGNDYVRDRIGTAMTEGLGVDYQRGRYIVVYYNGEYFGLHDLRERNNEYFYESHYGLDPNDIDLIDASNEASNGSSADYVAMIDWLGSNKLDNEANYNKIAEQIDIDNFMNYMAAEMFVKNGDWPHNNMKKWRVASQKSKWKWFLYDVDFGFGTGYNTLNGNVFQYVTNPSGTNNGGFGMMGMGGATDNSGSISQHTILMNRLLDNASFKNAFINRYCVLLTTNFEGNRLVKMIEKMQSEVTPEMARDQERWGFSSATMDKDYNTIISFATSRQQEILNEMSSYFSLGEMAAVSFNVQGSGSILVHNLPVGNSTTVNFFKDVPVTVTASSDGGVFTGWSDGVKDETRTINPGEVSSLTATFK